MSGLTNNQPIREAVQRALARGEVTLSGLSGELGNTRPHSGELKRTLGMVEYTDRYSRQRRRSVGMSRKNAERLFPLIALPEHDPAEFLVTVEGWFNSRKGRGASLVWGNGTPMVYSWRVRVLVDLAIAEDRTTIAKLARELGCIKSDAAPLKRALGLKPTNSSGLIQKKMDYDLAVWITYRLGLDPTDTGV